MKKYLIILVLLIFTSTFLFADIYRDIYAKTTYTTTLTNYSATDLSMGIFAGTANIWNPSPLSAYSNPAKLAFQEGTAVGYAYYENDTCKKINYYASIGWNGIGVLLPLPSYKSNNGSHETFDLPILHTSDKNDYVLSHADFGLGINIIKIFKSSLNNSTYKPQIGIGAKFYKYYQQLTEFSTSENTFDLGLICAFSPINNKNHPKSKLNLELSTGINLKNPFKTKAQYKIDNDNDGKLNEDPFDNVDNDGDGFTDEDNEEKPFYITSAKMISFAGKLSIPLETVGIKPDNDFIKNLFSITTSYDTYNSLVDNYNHTSIGIDFTFYDIISYRIGFNENINTSGFGFNLDFKDIMQLQVNTAKFNNEEQYKYDFFGKIDFIKLIKFLN